MNTHTEYDMTALSRLLQFTDSTFPVGTFSFSNGLETASFERIVHDAKTLRAFTASQARQAAFSDGVAAIHAHRFFLRGDYEAIADADRMLILFKMNDEARMMLRRMGKKFAELMAKLFDKPRLSHDGLQILHVKKYRELFLSRRELLMQREGWMKRLFSAPISTV